MFSHVATVGKLSDTSVKVALKKHLSVPNLIKERYFHRNYYNANGEMLFRSASEICTSVSNRCFFAPPRKAIWYSVNAA